MEKYLDDRVIIPERLKNMSKEELEQEIMRLEKSIIPKKNLENEKKDDFWGKVV